MPDQRRPVLFRGTSRSDLRTFPITARQRAGYQLDRVQLGLPPDDRKPMPSIGPGVQEIRIRDGAGAFRVIYIAKLRDAIYVLHCFQKKTEKTSRTDLALAKRRYQSLLKELKP